MMMPTGFLAADDAGGWALHYPKARIEAERLIDVPGGQLCERCACPTCGVVDKLLRVALRRAGIEGAALDRVRVLPALDTGSYPAIGSVRVDGCEVYRVHQRPDEVFEPSVVADILSALKRRK
jgi:hypothetical protein